MPQLYQIGSRSIGVVGIVGAFIGMVLAVDGSVSTDTFRAQVGDSVIITADGWEMVTDHPKDLDGIVI